MLDDAITFLNRSQNKYDLILSTVTSPIYFSSSKLYSKDFFELVKKNLSDDGMFVFWFDGRVNKVGQKILYQTLKETFGFCNLAYMRGGYTQVLCQENTPIIAHKNRINKIPSEVKDNLFQKVKDNQIEDLFKYINFGKNRIAGSEWGVPANTFDNLILETVALKDFIYVDDIRTNYILYQIGDIDYRSTTFQVNDLNDFELGERCYYFHLLGNSMPGLCIAKMNKETTEIPLSYLANTYNAIMEGRTKYIQGFTDLLITKGHFDRALKLMQRFKVGKGSHSYLIAAASEEMNKIGKLNMNDFNQIVSMNPFDVPSRQLLVEDLFKNGMNCTLVKKHVDFLEKISKLSDKIIDIRNKCKKLAMVKL